MEVDRTPRADTDTATDTTDAADADTAGGPAAAPAVRLAVSLIGLLAALFALGAARLACGQPLTGWLLPPALAAGAALAVWAARPQDGGRALAVSALRALGALGACAAAALAFGAAFYDVSWDGQVYHQQAVLALAEGWNPFWDAPLSIAARPDNIWINHYPKAAWIAQAILFRATGSLEAAKGLQLLPLAAAALLVFAALRARGLRPWSAGVLAALTAGNPVALAQVFTGQRKWLHPVVANSQHKRVDPQVNQQFVATVMRVSRP